MAIGLIRQWTCEKYLNPMSGENEKIIKKKPAWREYPAMLADLTVKRLRECKADGVSCKWLVKGI